MNVWIVGGSTGLGEGMAREFARRGHRVAVTARSADAVRAVAAAVGGAAYPGDATDRDSLRVIADAIRHRWGQIDVAVLNQGIYEPMPADGFDADVVRRHVDVNVMGTVHGIEAVLGEMRARRAGRIVVISSVTGMFGLPLAAAYGGTKAFLLRMCDSLRADLDGSGVHVTAVAPGFIRTRLTDANPFGMPFIIDVPEAASAIVDGVERGRDEIVLPRRMAMTVAVLSRLPAAARRSAAAFVARRIGGRGR